MSEMVFEENGLKLSSDSSLFLHVLRTVAAQAVLVGHGLSFFKIYPHAGTVTPRYMQNVGVVVFFILSGFLITYSTVEKSRSKSSYGFLNYFVDRVVRIYSGFLPAILCIVVLDFLLMKLFGSDVYVYKTFNVATFFANLFMLQDYPLNGLLGIRTPMVWTSFGSARPFWTIAVEWWMYMFFGWIYLWEKIKWRNIYKFIVLGLFSIVPLYHLIDGPGHGLTLVWFFGAALFVFIRQGFFATMSNGFCFFLSGTLLVAAMMRYRKITTEYDVLFAGIISVSLLMILVGLQQTQIIQSSRVKKVIVFLADYSFGLYLIHYTIVHFFLGLVPTGRWDRMELLFGSIVAANLASIVFALFTEMKHKQIRQWVARKYGV